MGNSLPCVASCRTRSIHICTVTFQAALSWQIDYHLLVELDIHASKGLWFYCRLAGRCVQVELDFTVDGKTEHSQCFDLHNTCPGRQLQEDHQPSSPPSLPLKSCCSLGPVTMQE